MEILMFKTFSKTSYLTSVVYFNAVFSVNLVYKEELNLMLKVSDLQSRCGGFELRGTDFFP